MSSFKKTELHVGLSWVLCAGYLPELKYLGQCLTFSPTFTPMLKVLSLPPLSTFQPHAPVAWWQHTSFSARRLGLSPSSLT